MTAISINSFRYDWRPARRHILKPVMPIYWVFFISAINILIFTNVIFQIYINLGKITVMNIFQEYFCRIFRKKKLKKKNCVVNILHLLHILSHAYVVEIRPFFVSVLYFFRHSFQRVIHVKSPTSCPTLYHTIGDWSPAYGRYLCISFLIGLRQNRRVQYICLCVRHQFRYFFTIRATVHRRRGCRGAWRPGLEGWALALFLFTITTSFRF